ncbi:Acyl-CoA dehydrogenase [Olavius sp. associated proteobacterium Delta 1]|nr:Acyl-CoA dehydrogenase [Olavius sp. associated proteobacterium Delta 1]
MVDRTFLMWPFFEARHRQLAEDIDAWGASHVSDLAAGEHEDLDGTCRTLVRGLGSADWTRYAVPASGGGLLEHLDVRSLCLIRETLGRYHALADFAFAMQGLGSGPLSLFGSPEQRQRYLVPASRGQKLAAFALSEPEAGSDVASLATTAKEEGNEFVLDGIKTWISNGGIADFYTVFARTEDAPGAKGLSCFVLDAGTPGFEVTERIDLIAPHPLATLRFDECRLSRDSLVGERGKGFKIAMATLDVFRSTVGAAALGFARRALEETIKHVSTRKLFGGTLSDLQLVQGKVADMALDVDASALLVYRSAWTKDCAAERVTREASMAKLYATEAAQRVIDAAVQLHGGHGVVRGNIVESLYRDIRALRIYEGASEVQQIIIARQLLT